MEKSNSAWGSQMKFEVNLFSFLEVSLKEYILGTRIGKKASRRNRMSRNMEELVSRA